MTDRELIKAEIERLRSDFPKVISQKEKDCSWLYWRGLNRVMDFINSLPEEPVNKDIDFEKELYKQFGQVKDFTLGMRIAKYFYELGQK